VNLEDKYVVIWLLDEAGKLFLGPPQPKAVRQWAVLGKVASETGVGVWIEIDELRERTGHDSEVAKTWKISPPLCLIKWSFIITIQVHGEEVRETPRIGFYPQEPTSHMPRKGPRRPLRRV
jgi:hypothetical protein